MTTKYVLPNRKAFADAITRTFIQRNLRDLLLDQEDRDVDACFGTKTVGKELYPYQKLVRDYLLSETPYRGLLVYHGLGSGKTCTSIAVAESLLDSRKIFVLFPATLGMNFKAQIRQCGDVFYQQDQFWESRSIKAATDKEHAISLGISEEYLDKHGSYFVTVPGREPNFDKLPRPEQKQISGQIDDVINQRFTFINYNGISSSNIDKFFPPDQPHMFDDSVVIIDEVHNLIGNVINKSELKSKIYDLIYKSRNSKIVLLSGTPMINQPEEIAFTMNLLKGPIERVLIPTDQVISWDEGMMTSFFKSLPDVDIIEYNSVKRIIMLTRNPPYFESVLNEKNERIAVKYNKELEFEPDIVKWVSKWRSKFEEKFNGTQLVAEEKITKEDLECLPTDREKFRETFIDGLKIKNSLLFQRRVQGLVSYYKGSDPRLFAKRIDEDQTLLKIPMSNVQFLGYLKARWIEIQMDSKRGRSNDDSGSFSAISRLLCNYAIPDELIPDATEEINGRDKVNKETILETLKQNPKRYFSDQALEVYSPKMLAILKNIKKFIGEAPFHSQFVYSNYKGTEGTGLLGAILEENGFQEYKLVKEGQNYVEDPSLKKGVPAFVFFTGDEKNELRDYYRQIFNDEYSDEFPAALKESVKAAGRKVCILMGSAAAAEGINLVDVRNVHIMESHWNTARIDQVIGRAIRLCSHKRLAAAERTVKVNLYLTVFNEEQKSGIEGPNIVPIRRNDTEKRLYDVDQPTDTFMTTDEKLYDMSYRKYRLAKSISILLKQAAVDCEIHRKLHARNGEIIQCMRFDSKASSEDLASNPSYLKDEKDTLFLRNIIRKKRRLQRIRVKGFDLLIDPDTNDIFDAYAFEDGNRLVKMGSRISATEIKWFVT